MAMRRLFTLMAALSLIVCMASIVLWKRSYQATDIMDTPIGEHREVGFVTWSGRVRIVYAMSEKSPFWTEWSVQSSVVDQMHQPFDVEQEDGNIYIRAITLPFWFLVLITVPIPAVEIARRIRKRKLGIGQCTSCGYDLRASPDRCPECGAAPAKK